MRTDSDPALRNTAILIGIFVVIGYGIVSLTQNSIEFDGKVALPKFLSSTRNFTLDAVNDYIPIGDLHLYSRNMSNRWSNVTGYTPLPNWTIDSQFAIFTNVTIPKVMEFPIDHPELCKDKVDAVIVVESAGSNRESRDILRNAIPLPSTWRRVFMVGHPILNTVRVTTCKHGDVCEPDTETEENLKKENEDFGDIVLADFTDVYQNLSMKTSTVMKWASTRCSNARFVFKADDDVYPHYPVLQKVLQQWIDQNLTENMWAGSKMWYTAIRSSSHTKVSFEEFPGFHYAYYVSGGRYAMSIDIARTMAAMTERVPFLPIEDVYMGLCGHMGGLEVFETDFYLPNLKGHCGWGFYYFSSQNSSQVLEEWKNDCAKDNFGLKVES